MSDNEELQLLRMSLELQAAMETEIVKTLSELSEHCDQLAQVIGAMMLIVEHPEVSHRFDFEKVRKVLVANAKIRSSISEMVHALLDK